LVFNILQNSKKKIINFDEAPAIKMMRLWLRNTDLDASESVLHESLELKELPQLLIRPSAAAPTTL
jgi:hypothetical protein